MTAIAIGQTYRSNLGAGPLRARIVSIDAERVRLYRWDERKSDKHRVYFTMMDRYLASPRCGWRLLP